MNIICPIAGAGTRLMPFTYSKPKAFIKVAGKKCIDHILTKLKKTFEEGTKLCFIVGYKKRQIMDYLTEHHSDYFNLQFVEQKPRGYTNDAPYFSGLGDAILLSKNYAKDDDCFIFLSDRLPIEDYSQILLKFHQEKCDGIINVRKVDNPQFYGVVEIDEEGKIKGIEEKPKEPKSHFAVSGAYLFGSSMSGRMFELLEEQSKIPLENGKEHQLTSVIQQLISEGFELKINQMKEEILDFGRPESLLEGNRHLLSEIKLDDPVYEALQQSGRISSSKIVPPVYIGKNVDISNSIIGPNVSIGDDVVIDKCILAETVIGDGSELSKIITYSSIVGDYSHLEDLIKQSIIIGDSSIIATSKMNVF